MSPALKNLDRKHMVARSFCGVYDGRAFDLCCCVVRRVPTSLLSGLDMGCCWMAVVRGGLVLVFLECAGTPEDVEGTWQVSFLAGDLVNIARRLLYELAIGKELCFFQSLLHFFAFIGLI